MVRILLAALVAALLWPAPATAAPKRVTPCSRGLVALTFDDGPLDTVTPRLVRVLTRLEVPATFFMVGNRVAAHPELVRMVDRAGFAIGNHTWAHADLTTQKPAQVRRALAATQRALVAAGVEPTALARPPYGAVDDRARKVMADLGLVPVLWTIDSRDWTGLTPKQISARVVDGVRRHRTNVVLQHDGVTNSPASVRSLSETVERLRTRGYCFAPLSVHGEPIPPVPVATVRPHRVRVPEGRSVRLFIRLDQPTTRETRVSTAAGIVRIPAGRQRGWTVLDVPGDRTDERTEELTVYPGTVVRVIDNDPTPVPSIDDAAVTASPLLPTPAPVTVRLDRASDRPTTVVVRSEIGPTRVVVPALRRQATGTLQVPTSAPRDGTREVTLHVPGATATLEIRPPEQTWQEAAREAVAQISWPAVRLGTTF